MVGWRGGVCVCVCVCGGGGGGGGVEGWGEAVGEGEGGVKINMTKRDFKQIKIVDNATRNGTQHIHFTVNIAWNRHYIVWYW